MSGRSRGRVPSRAPQSHRQPPSSALPGEADSRTGTAARRPSVQLQILVIRSFLVLHLLGILGVRLGFRPGLQLLGHVHVFPTPICGDRSEGGTATPKEGQVTQRMREQEDTQAEGEGATRGAGDWRHPPQDGMGVRMG